MSKGLYIAAMEPNSGKSLVVLGVIELLSTRVQNLGFFRPIVHDDPKTDRHIRLIRDRYRPGLPLEQMFGVGHVEARRAVADGNDEQLQKKILGRFRDMQQQCDFVVCEGTDFTGLANAFEFDFNAELANHLGCPVLI